MSDRIWYFQKRGKMKTAENYATALESFRFFREGKDISPRELSTDMMRDFQSFLTSRGLSRNTISLYMRQLRAAYNYAVDEEMIAVDRKPFRKVFTGMEKTRKRTLRMDTVRKLIMYRLERDSALAFARDIFLFSIYMQGMAFVDIAHLTKAQIDSGRLTYRRRKTGKGLTIVIPPCAKVIIDKYKVSHPDCPYLFPILYNPKTGKTLRFTSALRTYNNRLRRLSQRLGFDVPLSSYVARHTWASLARWNGVEDTVICEAMGHSHVGVTAIYLASLDIGTVASANRKVIRSLLKPTRKREREAQFSTS